MWYKKPPIGTPEYKEYISRRFNREKERRRDVPRMKSELSDAKRKRLRLKALNNRMDGVEAAIEKGRAVRDFRQKALRDESIPPRRSGMATPKDDAYKDFQRAKARLLLVDKCSPVIRGLLKTYVEREDYYV